MAKVWFTADTHFGHKRTLELSKRPFESVEEMDQVLIDNWNKIVGDDDIVYHLGDFGDYSRSLSLNGRIILLFGNYERSDVNRGNIKTELLSVGYNFYSVYEQNKIYYQDFPMVHEPSKLNDFEFGLFGHIHKLQMVRRNGLNVGVDCHNYKPIDLETVLFYKNAIENHYDEEVFGL